MKRRSFLKRAAGAGAAVPLAAALSGLPAASEAEAAPTPHKAPREPLTGRVPHVTRSVATPGRPPGWLRESIPAYEADLIVGYRRNRETGAVERYVFKSKHSGRPSGAWEPAAFWDGPCPESLGTEEMS